MITRTSLSRSGLAFGEEVGVDVGDATGWAPEVGGGTGKVSFCFASSSAVAPFANAIIFPSGDHCGLPAPRGTVVNCHASPPSSEIMNNCGESGRPSFSGTRTNARCLPSGDQRGEVSRVPPVSCFVSPLAVETIHIAVL